MDPRAFSGPDRSRSSPRSAGAASHGLARVLSKLGYCSRAEAFRLIESGRVTLNGRLCRNPEQRTDAARDRILVDGRSIGESSRVYLALNKPRGLVTTARDERGRPTVFDCLRGAELPVHLSPVGRLDQASEGLLLFSNDTAWAARLTDPAVGIEKTYHVQVDRVLDEAACRVLREGVELVGERLEACRVSVLRSGQTNSWLEVVLNEGRNRHIRRLCEAFGLEVLRLIRIRIGRLELGQLAKGSFRHLTSAEVGALSRGGG